MRELARKQLSGHDGDKMVIVDYLQLINTTQRDNRQVEYRRSPAD
jgi:replicative DNA helicase